MKAYSVDLRERVADAVLLDGLTWATTARLFRLSVASVGRFVLARRTGRGERQKVGGQRILQAEVCLRPYPSND